VTIRDQLAAELHDLAVRRRRLIAQKESAADAREDLVRTSTKVARYLRLHQEELGLGDEIDGIDSQIVTIASRLIELL
jgi:hypothetical protein